MTQSCLLGVPTLKEFAFAVTARLFVGLCDQQEPRFRALEEATEACLGGILLLPIDFPGTAYREGRLGRDTMYTIVDTLLADRKQLIWTIDRTHTDPAHFPNPEFEWKMVDPDELISIDPLPIFNCS